MEARGIKQTHCGESPQAATAASRAWPEVLDRSRWIWSDDDPAEPNVWIVARRTFLVRDKAPTWLNISADLRYLAWVNGHQVGFGPPKSDYRRPTLDRYDITSWLKRGRNVVAVQVYSLGNVEDISSCMPRQGGLIGSIERDGMLLGTDASWKLRRIEAYRRCALRRGDFQPHQEVYDARLSLGPVQDPALDDSDWPDAVELSTGPLQEYMEAIEWRDIPPMTAWPLLPEGVDAFGEAVFSAPLDPLNMDGVDEQILQARRQDDPADRVQFRNGAVVCDASDLGETRGVFVRWNFGEIWTGYPILTLQGQPGTVVDISYAEGLTDGRLDPSRGPTRYVDRIILGQGVETHRIFWPKSLGLLQVDVRNGWARIDSVELEASTYPVKQAGRFAASTQPDLARIWDISTHTVQLCMEDNYMDTPWRERGSWLGDILIHARTNYAAFGDTDLMRRFLRLHAMGALPDGSLCSKYPARRTTQVHTWNLTYPIALDDLYTFQGERQIVAECWPACCGMLRWLEHHRTPEGLYGHFDLKVTLEDNIYTFIDWAPVDTRGCNAAFNAIAYMALGSCQRLARIVGDETTRQLCARRGEELKHAFRSRLWDEQRGVFVNGWFQGQAMRRWGCQENYLALVTGLASPQQCERIIEVLQNEDLQSIFLIDESRHDQPYASMALALNCYDWDSEKMVPLGTPYFAYWAMKALFEAGLEVQALDLMRTHWGRFLADGATTVWEVWDRQGSLSHGWSAGPVPILSEYVLGVRRNPGDAHACRILPQRGDLDSARGAVPTCVGPMDVDWQYTPQGWSLDVTLPRGYVALAGLPGGDPARLWCDGQPIHSPHKLHAGRAEYLAVPLGPGEHHLRTDFPRIG